MQSDSSSQEQLDETSTNEDFFLPPCETSCTKILQEQQYQTNNEKNMFLFKEEKSIELIFIVFASYKSEIDKIANKYGFTFTITERSYLLSKKVKAELMDDPQQKNKFTKCKEEVRGFIYRIQFKEILEKYLPSNIYQSPLKTNMLAEKNIGLASFNNKVYYHSVHYPLKQLDAKAQEVFSASTIFRLSFKPRNKNIMARIFKHVAEFLRKSISYYQEKTKCLGIDIEVNKDESALHIIGSEASKLMAGKNTMKNVLESLVGLTIKGHQSTNQFKRLQKYCSKISKYPIQVSYMNKADLLIITKDNILSQLLQKKEKLKQLVNLCPEVQFGVFFNSSPSLEVKKQAVSDLCRKQGYDLRYRKGFTYFQKVFVEEKQDQNQILQLLILVTEQVAMVKEKFQISVAKKKIEKIKTESLEASNKDYLISEGKFTHQKLSELLKRDVLFQEVILKRKLIEEFQLCEGEEVDPIYWRAEDTLHSQLKQEQLGRGHFFQGKKRFCNSGKPIYLISKYIIIL